MKRVIVLCIALLVAGGAVAAQVTPPDTSGEWWYQLLEWIKGLFGGRVLFQSIALAGATVLLTALAKVLGVIAGLPQFAGGKVAVILSAVMAIISVVAGAATDTVITFGEVATVLQTVVTWVLAVLAYKGTLSGQARARIGKPV